MIGVWHILCQLPHSFLSLGFADSTNDPLRRRFSKANKIRIYSNNQEKQTQVLHIFVQPVQTFFSSRWRSLTNIIVQGTKFKARLSSLNSKSLCCLSRRIPRPRTVKNQRRSGRLVDREGFLAASWLAVFELGKTEQRHTDKLMTHVTPRCFLLV